MLTVMGEEIIAVLRRLGETNRGKRECSCLLEKRSRNCGKIASVKRKKESRSGGED
jgi:hypothetical protein